MPWTSIPKIKPAWRGHIDCLTRRVIGSESVPKKRAWTGCLTWPSAFCGGHGKRRCGLPVNPVRGFPVAAGHGRPRSSLFGPCEKRRPRLMTQRFGFIRVFSAKPARKAAKQHEDGVSRRRCRAAGTPEPRPRVLEQFQNAKSMDLANFFGWPDHPVLGMQYLHRTGISIHK